MLLGGGQDARATVDRASCPDSSGLIQFPGIRHFPAGVRMAEPQQDDINNPMLTYGPLLVLMTHLRFPGSANTGWNNLDGIISI